MSDYLAAIERVKNAVSSKPLVPHLTHYLIDNGEIMSTDGQLNAGGPFPDSGVKYMVPAAEFEKVLLKFGRKASIEVEQKSIVIKAGRYTARIATLADYDAFPLQRPRGEEAKNVGQLINIFRRLRPFVSDNATRPFAMAYRLRSTDVTVTNNIVLARSTHTLPKGFDHLVPVWAVDFVLARRDAVLSSVRFDKGSFSFLFDDGSWMMSPLIAEQFPDGPCDKMLEATPDATWAIPGDWREAFNVVAELSEDSVRLYPDRITGGVGFSEVQAEVKSPVKELTPFVTKQLKLVVETATYFDPSLFPKPCPWQSEGIKGVIMGRTG